MREIGYEQLLVQSEGWHVVIDKRESRLTLRHESHRDKEWSYATMEELLEDAKQRGITLTVGDIHYINNSEQRRQTHLYLLQQTYGK
ncbi:MAG: hypothetical protein KBT04_05885 [Bacteroidales bacterium]|nr:hypothetical protein [Candidatus Colimorpha onthohippi]